MKPSAALVSIVCLAFHAWAASPSVKTEGLPFQISSSKVVYEAKFDDAASLKDWVMEGGGSARIEAGGLLMDSPEQKDHLVYWLKRELPESFIATYDLKVLSEDGLCIAFIAAQGKGGQSIFAKELAPRSGQFKQYTDGDINNYLLQYYSQNPTHLEDTDNELRKNSGFTLLTKSPTAIPRGSEKNHRITIAKKGARVVMLVDDKTIIDFVDDGSKLGKPLGKGFFGLRQMKWTRARYANLTIHEIK